MVILVNNFINMFHGTLRASRANSSTKIFISSNGTLSVRQASNSSLNNKSEPSGPVRVALDIVAVVSKVTGSMVVMEVIHLVGRSNCK